MILVPKLNASVMKATHITWDPPVWLNPDDPLTKLSLLLEQRREVVDGGEEYNEKRIDKFLDKDLCFISSERVWKIAQDWQLVQVVGRWGVGYIDVSQLRYIE